MTNPINLTEDEINKGVIEMLNNLNISGSFNIDKTKVDLYKLIQNYLLNIDKRIAINNLLSFPEAAILSAIDIQNKSFEFNLKRYYFNEQHFHDNIIYYLKLKDLNFNIKDYENIYKIIHYWVTPEINTQNTVFKIKEITPKNLIIEINNNIRKISLNLKDIQEAIQGLD